MKMMPPRRCHFMTRMYQARVSTKTAFFCVFTAILAGACGGKGGGEKKDAGAEADSGSGPDGSAKPGKGDSDGGKGGGGNGGDSGPGGKADGGAGGGGGGPDGGVMCSMTCDDKVDCTTDKCIATDVCS